MRVYRLDICEAKGNAYELGIRHESWCLRRVNKVFDQVEEARAYVRSMNRQCSDLPLYLVSMKTTKEREEFVDRFCFGEEYWADRRYFLGHPPVGRIREALQAQGIRVQME